MFLDSPHKKLSSYYIRSCRNKHTSVSRAKSAASAPQPLSFEHKFNLDRQMLNRDEVSTTTRTIGDFKSQG